MTPRPILLCTVGTSLFYPNLAGLRRALADDLAKADEKKAIKPALRPVAERLADAYDARDWAAVGRGLLELPPTERLGGAEVNSVASLVATGYATADRSRPSWPACSPPAGTPRSRQARSRA